MHAAIAAQSWPAADASTLSPGDTAATVRAAWAAAAPHVELAVVAVPDGGPRSLGALTDTVSGPVTPVGGAIAGRVGDAVVLAPARGARWEPSGLLAALIGLAAAGERGTVLVPLGDIAPAGDAMDLWGGGLDAARASLAALEIVALVGADRPLLGFTGMSASVRDGREHDSALARAAQEQEERWAAVARDVDPAVSRRMLIGSGRLSDEPGSGAAGGLAYALGAVGARLVPAAPAMAQIVGFDRVAAAADVVVAVSDRLDARSLDHGIVGAAAELAGRRGVPCVTVTASLGVGRRDLMAAGVSGAHEGEPGEPGLADQVRRVAQTWAPRW